MSHVADKETERIRNAVWHQRRENNLTKEQAIEHVAKVRGKSIEYIRSKVASMRNKRDVPPLFDTTPFVPTCPRQIRAKRLYEAAIADGKDKGKAKQSVMLAMGLNDCELAELLTPPEAIEHYRKQLIELDRKRQTQGVVPAGTREFTMRLSDGRGASFAETATHC